MGRAIASARGTRRVVGVSATGMTACPCAQELVSSRARARLADDGFSEGEIDRVLERVPVATHNQRGLGTLNIGCIEECDAQLDATALLAIVEGSMSSEIYELMKRSDEVEVVEKAHRRPRFVEDCVREMIADVVESLPRAGGRELRLRPPGEPRDDPPAQRRRRAPRQLASSARGRLGRARAHQTTIEEWLYTEGSARRLSRRRPRLCARRGLCSTASRAACMWRRRPKK